MAWNRTLFLIALAAIAAAIVGCKSPGPNAAGAGNGGSGKIIIGHYASMSGDDAVFGTTTDHGAKLAVEEINAAGGVLGRQIELITLDTRSTDVGVPPIIDRFYQEGATAIVGEVASGRTLAAAPKVEAYGIPMVSPSSTNVRVTVDPDRGVRKWVFRTCFIDPFQGEVIARFAHGKLGKRRAAILFDRAQPYSVGLAESFKQNFIRLGGQVVAEEGYTKDDQEFGSQLTRIKGLDPDVLIVPGYYSQVKLIVTQARGRGLDVPIVGGDGWDDPQGLTRGAEQAFKDTYFVNHFSPLEEREGVRQFVEAYRQRWQEDPNALAALGYDAVQLVADAIKRAGSTDRTAVRDALEKTQNYAGVTGTISVDAQHNPRKTAVVVKAEGSPFPLVDVYPPQ
ncbi:MAG: ABC transporter substrate-binding protein [Armatimonadetes bacterium]|nr:ABC transporter substrate-binding protein [Armatimonadota bacterium]